MANRGLGRGLGALFGEEELPLSSAGVARIPLRDIEPNENQPRKRFDKAALEELAESIRQNGIITPLTLRRPSGGRYQIIAGERRWRAAKLAGLGEVPAMVLDAEEDRTLVLALVENLQRQDLDPMEEARGYRSLLEDFALTQEEVAKKVGVSRPAVANALRLLALPEKMQSALETGELTPGHARALLSVTEPGLRESLFEKILREKLSVREAERLAKKAAQKPAGESAAAQKGMEASYTRELERKLKSALGRKVTIVPGRKKGRLELEYYDNDDLERLMSQLLRLKG